MKLVLPEKFRNIVQSKTNISGALDTLIDKFSDWLTNNKTEFFPEYTDHGIDHIQSVLNTSEEIISEIAWEFITPEDIYVLTSSALLHDCAMHISKEGLWDLLTNDLYNGVLLGFENEMVWSKRWETFSNEVKRFDEHDYVKFFGEFRDVQLPKIGSKSLDDDQKIIIGDFIRRYHASIAQIIATHGIPSVNNAIDVFDSDFNYLNQLSGLIARSHNHKLRDVVDLLGDDRKREHRGTHPTFLMGILRIADYLQLKSDRTPKILFNTIAFCSPISIKEWKKHLSIISTNDYHPDDELLFIEAFPEDATTLVGVKELLLGLQKELDEYWAVTGEVYSRYSPLNNLILNYRRVKSNIDDPAKYVERNHKKYYPEVLSVKAENQKLFPLLIKPLYGDLPQVGIRELLQNSLDATNERYSQEVEGNVNELSIPYEINMILDFNKNTFTLKDNGAGMNVEIVKDYFLKVGSSYRMSEHWKSKFALETTSKVPRTGKFGIGMLAGFLIGDSIDVHTKHVGNESRALKFSYKLDSDEIEIKYLKKDEVGTSITVHSDADRLKIIEESLNFVSRSKVRRYPYHEDDSNSSWWYFMDTPKVNYSVINDDAQEIKKPLYLIKKDELLHEWNKLIDSELDGFYWRHNEENSNVYCNGIMIQKMDSPNITIVNPFGSIILKDIEICVFDNAGLFPLNLTRDELVTNDFYEIEKLKDAVKSNFIDTLYPNYTYDRNYILKVVNKYSKSFSHWSKVFIPLVFKNSKAIPFSSLESKENKLYTLVDFVHSSTKRGLIHHKDFDILKDNFYYSCFNNAEKKADTIELAIDNLLLNRHESGWDFIQNESINTKQDLDTWLYVKKYDYNKLSDENTQFMMLNNLTAQELDNNWIVISKKEHSLTLPNIAQEICALEDSNIFIFALYKVKKVTASEFSELWESRT